MSSDDFDLDEAESSVDWAEKLHSYYYQSKQLLKRFWWIPLLTICIGVLYQSWVAYQYKPTYSSNALIMHNQFTTASSSDVLREQYSNWFGNQVLILTSGDVQRAAHERVRSFHRDIMPSRVSVSPSQLPDTTAIRVHANGDNSDYTQLFLDALLDEYMNRRQQMKGETSEVALTALTERLLVLEDEIRTKEDAIVDFRKKNNLISIQEQGDKAGMTLARLRARQMDIRTQVRLLETLGLDYELQSPGLLGGTTSSNFSPEGAVNYRETKQGLSQLRAQLEEFSHYLKPRHPKIISLQQDIERMDNLLNIYREQTISQMSERRSQLRVEIDNLDIVISEQEVIALENSRLAAEFDRLQSNLKRSQTLYESLLRQMQTIETGQEVTTEVVNIFQPASKPVPILLSSKELVVKGGFIGAILGFGVIGLIGLVDSRILSGDDLKKRFDAPIFSVIPLESRNREGKLELLTSKDKRHLFSEACRALRSSLMFLGEEGKRPSVILITSSIPEEGKSTIAANLATAVAFTSARVLLIDCDLRRGQLATTFNLPSFPGMSDLLQKGRRLDAVVQKTHIENLDFVAAGEYPERPGELLLSYRMDEILKEVRAAYDYVIIDTAPILATDDTTGFAVKADAALYVVRSGYTQARQVKASIDRLKLRGIEIDGFVLNCVDIRGTDYYYYKKYNDYYAYSAR